MAAYQDNRERPITAGEDISSNFDSQGQQQLNSTSISGKSPNPMPQHTFAPASYLNDNDMAHFYSSSPSSIGLQLEQSALSIPDNNDWEAALQADYPLPPRQLIPGEMAIDASLINNTICDGCSMLVPADTVDPDCWVHCAQSRIQQFGEESNHTGGYYVIHANSFCFKALQKRNAGTDFDQWKHLVVSMCTVCPHVTYIGQKFRSGWTHVDKNGKETKRKKVGTTSWAWCEDDFNLVCPMCSAAHSVAPPSYVDSAVYYRDRVCSQDCSQQWPSTNKESFPNISRLYKINTPSGSKARPACDKHACTTTSRRWSPYEMSRSHV